MASRFRQIMERAEDSAREAGREFRPFRCHDLRHTYSIRALRQGVSIWPLARHLGHSNVKTTEGYAK